MPYPRNIIFSFVRSFYDYVRSKVIIAVILNLVGLILLTVGYFSLIATIQYYQRPENAVDAGSSQAIRGYVTFGILILLGLVLLIVAFVMDILAWGRLKTFFKENMSMFPGSAGKNAQTGCLLMQIGAIIGILRVVGCFLLYSLKKSTE